MSGLAYAIHEDQNGETVSWTQHRSCSMAQLSQEKQVKRIMRSNPGSTIYSGGQYCTYIYNADHKLIALIKVVEVA